MTAIPFLTPRMPAAADVATDVAAIWQSGTFTNSGPVEHLFERALADFIGGEVGVAVTSNATTAIMLASGALMHGDRPHVLIASFTAAAVPLAARWSGFAPLLVDVEPETWQPDAGKAEQFLEREGHNVAGIILTNTFGTANPDIERWEAIATRFSLSLVVDSAAGWGSQYPWGERLGRRGDCEIFSFHATKTMAVGEGGAVATRNTDIVEAINRLKNYGFDADRRSQLAGLNGKLPEVASAIGLRQLATFESRIERRRAVLGCYKSHLEEIGCCFQTAVMQSAPPFVSVALPHGVSRRRVGEALDDSGIGWRAYYNPPIHRQPSFAGVRTLDELIVTEDLADRMLSLPLDDELSEADVVRVARAVARGMDAGQR
ncbi:MAG: aminotransferase class I/II-fold pyridoxal phosphate-dependent enzyme [Candidatus Dormibacteraeota bacterium]|nr:aminotransferase class I/II-fold pyridoxal phosphate-dependent enzyme [Candidatus Dormibacteraeota bacterium]